MCLILHTNIELHSDLSADFHLIVWSFELSFTARQHTTVILRRKK